MCEVSAERWKAGWFGGWKREGMSPQTSEPDRCQGPSNLGGQIRHLDSGEQFGPAEEEKGGRLKEEVSTPSLFQPDQPHFCKHQLLGTASGQSFQKGHRSETRVKAIYFKCV